MSDTATAEAVLATVFKRIPEPAIVLAAALIGLVVHPFVHPLLSRV